MHKNNKKTIIHISLLVILVIFFLGISSLAEEGRMAKRNITLEIAKIAKECGWKLLTTLDNNDKVIFEIKNFKDNKTISIPLKAKMRLLESAIISPDGFRIAFWANEEDSVKLYMADCNGKNITKLIKVEGGGLLSWSSDSQNIAFVGSIDKLSNSIGFGLYTINIKSKNVQTLVKHDIAYITNQAYSPDMSKIVYAKSIKKNDAVMIYDFKEKKTYKLTEGGYPAWSPKSDLIAYLDNNNNLTIIDSKGETKQTLIKNEPIGSPIYWLPNGQYILYGKYQAPNDEIGVPSVVKVDTAKSYNIEDSFNETWMLSSWSLN